MAHVQTDSERSRILPDAIVDSFDLGKTIEELQDGFPHGVTDSTAD